MTDEKDKATPVSPAPESSGDAPADFTEAPGAARPDADTRPRRGIGRRGWTLIVAGSLVVIIVLICVAIGAVIAAVRGAVDRSEQEAAVAAEARTDVEAACLDLEQRLNRLTPPGATTGPQARAKAIRDENTAARPFLLELERIRGTQTEADQHYLGQEWTDGWRQLVDARSSYADALDRAADGGEPAFYLAPRDEQSEPVSDELIADGPDGCDGALRRLADPAL